MFTVKDLQSNNLWSLWVCVCVCAFFSSFCFGLCKIPNKPINKTKQKNRSRIYTETETAWAYVWWTLLCFFFLFVGRLKENQNNAKKLQWMTHDLESKCSHEIIHIKFTTMTASLSHTSTHSMPPPLPPLPPPLPLCLIDKQLIKWFNVHSSIYSSNRREMPSDVWYDCAPCTYIHSVPLKTKSEQHYSVHTISNLLRTRQYARRKWNKICMCTYKIHLHKQTTTTTATS